MHQFLKNLYSILLLLVMSQLSACENNQNTQKKDQLTVENFQPYNWDTLINQSNAPVYTYKVIHQYPHNIDNFTQGLQLEDNHIYESVGLFRKSRLIRSDKDNGKVLLQHDLPLNEFAEGLTIFNDQIYQLTYASNTVYVYNKNTFAIERKGSIPYQGWGLTHTNNELVLSNGTAALIFLNPQTLAMTHYVIVHDKNKTIPLLNELEYINGKIYANILGTELIAIISPHNGEIEGWINLKFIYTDMNNNPTCKITNCPMNGIAYDDQTNELLITGKNWAHIYSIQLIKK